MIKVAIIGSIALAGAASAYIYKSKAIIAPAQAANCGYQVVRSYPHDTGAFTEGLFFLDGFLYESTGLNGQSSIRKVSLVDGKIAQQVEIPDTYFGEGIVNWRDEIIGVTWKNQTGFRWDRATFIKKSEFSYTGEGWGLTQNGSQIIMSDGTSDLRFFQPDTMNEVKNVEVTLNGKPVTSINELEWVKGSVLANIWQTDQIIRIDPNVGKVTAVYNMAGLRGLLKPAVSGQDVLNGIAYDKKGDRLFVTGKNWPSLFEIKLAKGC